MGMEEEAGSGLAGAGAKGDWGKSEGRVRGSWQQKGGTERADRREGARQRAKHFGTLGRRGCLGY